MLYWSHLSYVWVWTLLVIHCANFWKWFLVPGVAFLLEKLVGVAVSHMGGLYIIEVNLLPSKVPLNLTLDPHTLSCTLLCFCNGANLVLFRIFGWIF